MVTQSMIIATKKKALISMIIPLIAFGVLGQGANAYNKTKWLEAYHGNWIAISGSDTLILSMEYDMKTLEGHSFSYDGVKGFVAWASLTGNKEEYFISDSTEFQVDGPSLIQGIGFKNRKKIGISLKIDEGKLTYKKKGSSEGTLITLDGYSPGSVQLDLIEKELLNWTILSYDKLVVMKQNSEQAFSLPEKLTFKKMK